MTHDLKPYPAYKDSGVPWLGQVPASWSIRENPKCFPSAKRGNAGERRGGVLGR